MDWELGWSLVGWRGEQRGGKARVEGGEGDEWMGGWVGGCLALCGVNRWRVKLAQGWSTS